MADGFIVRRGGAGGGLQALAPTITIIDTAFTDVTFTITNNDPQPAVIRYRIDNVEDLGEIVELAGNTTSTNLTFDGLSEGTSYFIFANANVAEKVKSETAQQEFTTDTIPAGLIVMWFGQSNEVPSGWALCNGSGATPDLRNRFIVGAGDTFSIGNTGGFANTVLVEHTHSGQTGTATGTHTHAFGITASLGQNIYSLQGRETPYQPNAVQMFGAGNHSHTGSFSSANAGQSGNNRNIPPYRGLFYIIKEVV